MAESTSDGRAWIFPATKAYEYLLRLGGALIPLLGVWYLQTYQSPLLCTVEHTFHNIAVFLAIVVSAFVAFVTWRCYQFSGEPFLRWLTLGFIGFTLIYAPHGLFTQISDLHMALFLLYGPASRLVMGSLLFIGLLNYGRSDDAQAARNDHMRWWRWGAFFLAIDIAIALVAETSLLQMIAWRMWMEGGALVIAVVGIAIVLRRHRSSPLMMTYALSLALFAESSVAFLLAKPWNHQWWFGHILFAIGFFVLSFDVIRAFHTTGAFATVFGVEELMAKLRAEKSNTEDALRKLQEAHAELALMAATDALTGACSRRHFLKVVEIELARAKRSGSPVSILALDIDHFKAVNDQHGHQAGDAVLKACVAAVQGTLRPSDVVGRVGGEEFVVLLPETSRDAAVALAERIRHAVDCMALSFEGGEAHITVSLGVAEFGVDGDGQDAVFKVADARLYRAKHEGRNRVVS